MRDLVVMQVSDGGAGLSARVTTATRGVRDGEIYPVQLKPGDIVRGDLARALIGASQAVRVSGPVENKAVEVPVSNGPFRTGETKQSSSPRPAPRKTKATSKKRAAKRG